MKQTDYNGDYFYAKLAAILIDSKQGPVIVSPNPFASSFHLIFGDSNPEKTTIKLFDIKGASLFSQEFSINELTSKINIDMTKYNPGLYILKIFKKNEVIEKIIVKLP